MDIQNSFICMKLIIMNSSLKRAYTDANKTSTTTKT